MQQQTRQRQRRQRKNTPLPEKRRRKRQTTRRCHANTTLRHVVTPAIPTKEKRMVKKSGEQSREEKTKLTTRETQRCSGITCVLARLRAHYPEHQHKRKKKTKRRGRQTTRPHTPTPTHRHSTTQQHSATKQHAHHTETHTTTHEELTMNSGQ